jgi:hypothetical protein
MFTKITYLFNNISQDNELQGRIGWKIVSEYLGLAQDSDFIPVVHHLYKRYLGSF